MQPWVIFMAGFVSGAFGALMGVLLSQRDR